MNDRDRYGVIMHSNGEPRLGKCFNPLCSYIFLQTVLCRLPRARALRQQHGLHHHSLLVCIRRNAFVAQSSIRSHSVLELTVSLFTNDCTKMLPPRVLQLAEIAYHHPLFWFIALFIFRYLRLIVHIFSFWILYRPSPVPAYATIIPRDVTVILPTVDPENADFRECIQSCFANAPYEILIVTVGRDKKRLCEEVVAQYATNTTRYQVLQADIANKRHQVATAIPHVETKITLLLDDHVFWPSPRFLQTVLAPFEDPNVGAVGMNKRVRRTDKGFNMRSFWNMIGAIYLERHNFEIRATNAIDGGVFVISGRTSLHRTQILQDEEFLKGFTDERFFFGLCGPLNPDDDNYITRFEVSRGWKIKIQYGPDAVIETTLGTYPKFMDQCLRWVRTTWRSNSCSLFTDRTVWLRQPW